MLACRGFVPLWPFQRVQTSKSVEQYFHVAVAGCRGRTSYRISIGLTACNDTVCKHRTRQESATRLRVQRMHSWEADKACD